MNFEPLIHVSFPNAVAVCIMWSVLIALVCGCVACLVMLIAKNREDMLAAVGTSIIVGFLSALMFVAPAVQNDQIDKNEKIVFTNLNKKYQVEMITFPPVPSRGPRESYPEQSEPQKVMVKVAGKTRPAILTQDEKTSEPTLIDVDNGKPMDDILRK